jgi:hypothetical protein
MFQTAKEFEERKGFAKGCSFCDAKAVVIISASNFCHECGAEMGFCVGHMIHTEMELTFFSKGIST